MLTLELFLEVTWRQGLPVAACDMSRWAKWSQFSGGDDDDDDDGGNHSHHGDDSNNKNIHNVNIDP